MPYTKYVDAIDIAIEPIEDQIASLDKRTHTRADIWPISSHLRRPREQRTVVFKARLECLSNYWIVTRNILNDAKHITPRPWRINDVRHSRRSAIALIRARSS